MTALLTAVLATGGLVGCTSTQTDGNPTTAPQTGTETTTGSQPTSSGADSGLSVSKYVADPCSILKPDQVATLGSLRAPQAGKNTLGSSCTWKGQDVIKNSTYEISVTEGKSFDSMVANVKDNPVFTDKEIDGVRVISTDRANGELACLVSLQASDTDSVTVQISTASDERATKKACPEGERVAQLIITNLKG